MTPSWQILQGDCRDVLRGLPERSVQACVTSPPYFGLRDYGHEGQIGLEPTPDEFVAALVGVFREVRRVLRDDGTVWLNLGDSFCGAGYANRDLTGHGSPTVEAGGKQRHGSTSIPGLKPKDLLGVPWAVAFALRADGWYLRSDIIWAKPNPMPESVTDRPTKAHEYVFLLSKGPRYFYDADAIREADSGQDHARTVLGGQPSLEPSGGVSAPHKGLRTVEGRDGMGRNKRSVWSVATQPFAGAHFATFPPKLIEPCILAGTAPKACGVCGTAWRRVVERIRDEVEAERIRQRPGRAESKASANGDRRDGDLQGLSGQEFNRLYSAHTVGWESGCEHDDDTGRCVVLDPFNGAGTTGLVALRHDRSYIGVELNAEYAEMARRRIIDDAPLLNAHSHKEAA